MKRKTKGIIVAAVMLSLLSISALAKEAPAAPVNINTASAEELTTIPGVGPAKAKAIIDYRLQKPFANVDELVEVKGIGDKMLAKIRAYVTTGAGTVLPAAGQTNTTSPSTAVKPIKG